VARERRSSGRDGATCLAQHALDDKETAGLQQRPALVDGGEQELHLQAHTHQHQRAMAQCKTPRRKGAACMPRGSKRCSPTLHLIQTLLSNLPRFAVGIYIYTLRRLRVRQYLKKTRADAQ
jgi:hypothetical protein